MDIDRSVISLWSTVSFENLVAGRSAKARRAEPCLGTNYLWDAGLEFIRGDLRQYAGCAERAAYDGGSLSASRQNSIVFTCVIQVHFAAALRRTLDNSACCPPNWTAAAHAGARAVWELPNHSIPASGK